MMRKKKIKKPHVHNYFHLTYLLYLPLIFLLAMYIWSISIRTAREQIKNLAYRERIQNENPARQGNITYRVQPEDTIQSISKDFKISVDTIRWANNLNSDELIVDSIIIIPPITGVTHVVKYGDTIGGIANKYKVDPEAILNYEFNRFSDDEAFPLIVGETLYIPYGRK